MNAIWAFVAAYTADAAAAAVVVASAISRTAPVAKYATEIANNGKTTTPENIICCHKFLGNRFDISYNYTAHEIETVSCKMSQLDIETSDFTMEFECRFFG